jgi:hypothetical protein
LVKEIVLSDILDIQQKVKDRQKKQTFQTGIVLNTKLYNGDILVVPRRINAELKKKEKIKKKMVVFF